MSTLTKLDDSVRPTESLKAFLVSNEYTGAPTSETLPPAKTYAERALSLDSQLAEPHATLGTFYELSWQWSEAENEFKRAIEINPS